MKKENTFFRVKKFSFLLLAFFAILFLFSGVMKAEAAQFSLQTTSQNISPGSEFSVSLFLNPQQDSLNALQGDIVFPDNILQAQQIQDGDSLVNFWIQEPDISQPGVIHFSGIIPGGYDQPKGFIFSVVFKAIALGQPTVAVQNAQALINDGKGTAADVTTLPLVLSVVPSGGASAQAIQVTKDTAPPESFKPEISRSPDLFGGKWFLVFATQDKASGIDHYEIREGVWGGFHDAASPYLLHDQNLDQEIFVKAVDKSGNTRLEVVYPPNVTPWYKNYWILGIIVLILLCCAGIAIILVWKKSKS